MWPSCVGRGSDRSSTATYWNASAICTAGFVTRGPYGAAVERLLTKHQLFLMASGVVLATLLFSVTGLGARSHTHEAFLPACLGLLSIAAGVDRALRRRRMCAPERVRACRDASRHLSDLVEVAATARKAAGMDDGGLSIGHGIRGGEPVVTVVGKPFLRLPSKFRGFPVVRVER